MPSSPLPRRIAASLLLLGLALPVVAQDPAPVAPAPEAETSATELPDLAPILEDLAEIRRLEFKSEVPSALQTPEDFRDFVSESLETEWPAEQRARQMRGLARLGLVEPALDLADEMSDALMSQAAAYYDPAQKKFFYLAGDMPPDLLRATAAHELVHALQDQHFDLTKMFRGIEGAEPRNDDAVLALRYLVEGEATYVQTIWQLDQMLGGQGNWEQAVVTARQAVQQTREMDLDDFIQASRSMLAGLPEDSSMRRSIESMEDIPPYVLLPLMDAYMQGAAFVGAVHGEKGSWADVDRLYGDPPRTAEQCLHPERYLERRDHPTPVELPDFPELTAAGWETSDAAVHGELYLRILLRRLEVERQTAKLAAAGWDGDLYRAYEKSDGRTAMVLSTTWDSDNDATEFFFAYRDALARKYPELQELPLTAPGAAQSYGYGTGESRFSFGVLARRGREVFAIEGFTGQLTVPLLRRLLAHEIEHVD